MKNLLLPFFFIISLATVAQDMSAYLKNAQALAREGKNQEALDAYIWFHEHALEHDQAMAGVRLSFALSYWKQLGDHYAPAQAALVNMRDKKYDQIIAGLPDNVNVNLFQDVSAINRVLKEEPKTVALFENILSKNKDVANRVWPFIKDYTLSSRNFTLAAQFIKNPMQEFDRIKSLYLIETAQAQKLGSASPLLSGLTSKRLVDRSLELIDFCTSIKDFESAKNIKKAALDLLQDPRLSEAVTDH